MDEAHSMSSPTNRTERSLLGYPSDHDAPLLQEIQNNQLSHGVSGEYCVRGIQYSQKPAADWVYISPYSVLLESDVLHLSEHASWHL